MGFIGSCLLTAPLRQRGGGGDSGKAKHCGGEQAAQVDQR
ncbi:MAG: hypothetical protein HLUCCX21_05595 [Porphyrobacter sp. HL-46]|nr:MAG: hypothetical protein HLUCCX21_05595 [Porphyrobacter sp. HL-46]